MPSTLGRRTVLSGVCVLVAFAVLGAMPVSAQEATPPRDPTVTALERDKLAWEVAKLEEETAKLQEETARLRSQNDQSLLDWLQSNAIVIAGLVGGVVTVYRWWVDRDEEREKRDEDRLAVVVDGLGSPDEGMRINAAYNLRTFLEPGYKRFHIWILYLVVAHLRLQPKPDGASLPPITPGLITGSRRPPPAKGAELPLFTQALVTVFKAAYREVYKRAKPGPVWQEVCPREPIRTWLPTLGQALVTDFKAAKVRTAAQPGRGWWREQGTWRRKRALLVVRQGSPLDMSNIQLPGASLAETVLSGVWMHTANLHEADLNGTDLTKADLSDTDLTEARLGETILSKADLNGADLTGADATKAILTGADLRQAHLTGAKFCCADLRQAVFGEASFVGVRFDGANLADVDLSATNLTQDQLNTVLINDATKLPKGLDRSKAKVVPEGWTPESCTLP